MTPGRRQSIVLSSVRLYSLKKLIKPRLTDAILAAGEYSPTQYGFRAGRSIIDAIEDVVHAVKLAEAHSRHCRAVVLLVSVDVKSTIKSA